MMTEQQVATKVLQTLTINGYQAYLVGGCVRDLILGRGPKDYDICTNATPDQVVHLFETVDCKVLSIGAAFGVIAIVMGSIQVEVATYRTDGIYTDGRRPETVTYGTRAKDDVDRRDFTMNGLLKTAIQSDVVDYVGGVKDIDARMVRCIGNPTTRFSEDALRMLRAIRFAVQLDFEIEQQTWDAMCEHANLITHVSRERVRDELVKMLTSPDPARALYLLNQSGLLGQLFSGMARIPLGITMQKLAWVARIQRRGTALRVTWLDLLAVFGAELDHDGFVDVMDSLKLARADWKVLVNAFAWRNLFLALGPPWDTAARVRFLRQGGAQTAMLLFRAEISTCHRFESDMLARASQLLNALELTRLSSVMTAEPFITGDDLVAAGVQAGPMFKSYLHQLEDRQLNGELQTRVEALTAMNALVGVCA